MLKYFNSSVLNKAAWRMDTAKGFVVIKRMANKCVQSRKQHLSMEGSLKGKGEKSGIIIYCALNGSNHC